MARRLGVMVRREVMVVLRGATQDLHAGSGVPAARLPRRVAPLCRSPLVLCWLPPTDPRVGGAEEGGWIHQVWQGAKPVSGFPRYKRAGWAWVCTVHV